MQFIPAALRLSPLKYTKTKQGAIKLNLPELLWFNSLEERGKSNFINMFSFTSF